MPVIDHNNKLLEWKIPTISKNTLNAIQHVYSGKKWGKHLTKVQHRLIQENPQLVKFIENQVGKYPPEMHSPMFEVFVGTITVLEHQAMVDEKQLEKPKK